MEAADRAIPWLDPDVDLAALEDHAPVDALPGVKNYFKRRFRELYNIRTLGDLREEAARQLGARPRRRVLETFVNNLARNRRADTCQEGYVVPPYNAVVRRVLTAFLRANFDRRTLPDSALPLYADATRRPPRPPGDVEDPENNPPVARSYADRRRRPRRRGGEHAADEEDVRPRDLLRERVFYPQTVVARVRARLRPELGGWPFPYAHPGNAALPTSAAAAAGGAGQFPYGRSDYLRRSALRTAATRAERNALLRNPHAPEGNRRFWPCACFRSRGTCRDFARRHGNRLQSGQAYCRWDDVEAQCVADRR